MPVAPSPFEKYSQREYFPPVTQKFKASLSYRGNFPILTSFRCLLLRLGPGVYFTLNYKQAADFLSRVCFPSCGHVYSWLAVYFSQTVTELVYSEKCKDYVTFWDFGNDDQPLWKDAFGSLLGWKCGSGGSRPWRRTNIQVADGEFRREKQRNVLL